jgi:hypothetical protein
MKIPLILGTCLLLSACGSPLEGTYSDEMGVTNYTFKDDDKVYMSVMGTETELDYSVEDGKVKITSPQGNMIFTLNEDGTLQGPMGMKLSKKAE